MSCVICGEKCLIREEPAFPIGIATHQRIYSKQDIDDMIEVNGKELRGPDTLLFQWQVARFIKDYEESDRLREWGRKRGLAVAFCGDHYECHEDLRFKPKWLR